MLVLIAQAAAAATGTRTADAPRKAESVATGKANALQMRSLLARKLKAAHKHRTTIRFFKTHRQLMRSTGQRAIALRALRRSTRGLKRTTKEIAYYRRLIRLRKAEQLSRRLASAPPRVAICGVFGRYCRQAVSVAWCESHLSTKAENGQYLGLFQMGSQERRLFGHGRTAHQQALAAHRYFVRSGRDWSPWSCGWAAS